MANSKTHDLSSTPHNQLYVALHRACPQLTNLMMRNPEDFVSLTLRQRGTNDVIAIMKRYAPDGGQEVLFGTGYDALGALLGLEGACAANRWRPDAPWVPNGGK